MLDTTGSTGWPGMRPIEENKGMRPLDCPIYGVTWRHYEIKIFSFQLADFGLGVQFATRMLTFGEESSFFHKRNHLAKIQRSIRKASIGGNVSITPASGAALLTILTVRIGASDYK